MKTQGEQVDCMAQSGLYHSRPTSKRVAAYTHLAFILQPFLRYSKLFVENCVIFIPHLCLAPQQGVTPSEFREDV